MYNSNKKQLICNFYCIYIDIIKFSQSAYSVDEDNGMIAPELIVSDISLTDFTVQVISISESASGKFTMHVII